MKNIELYSPACPDKHAKALVMAGPLRGLLDSRGCYYHEKLLEMQLEVFKEWREAARKDRPAFDCHFYEWMLREEDSAFVLKPGQLVKWDNKEYGVVSARLTHNVGWVDRWHVVCASRVEDPWPQPMKTVEIKLPDGRTHVVNALAMNIEPADIPPEVFALACRRAKDCPMMKGGME